MKKKRVLAGLALAALAALAAGGLLLPRPVKTLEASPFSGARGVMRVTAEAGEDLRRVTGTQTYEAANGTGRALDSLVLRLYPNAVQEGSLVLGGLTVDGEAAAFSPDADDPSVVRVPLDWQPGQTRRFSWRFTLTVPAGEGYAFRADGAALCVGALAVPALWDGDWRTDAYDALAGPLGASSFDYELTLAVPGGVNAVFGGEIVACAREGGMAAWTVRDTAALDMPFALRTGGALRQRWADGVLLTALAQSGSRARALLSAAEKALTSLREAGIPFSARALGIVQAQTGFGDGLTGTGLLAVPDGLAAEARLRLVTRLAARQTFGVAAQNDPWEAPWLSLSLASSAELLAYRARAGEAACARRVEEEMEVAGRLTRPNGVTVGASVWHFGGDTEMTQVLRDQGGAMLLGIERAIGEEAYVRALSLYVRRAEGALADREMLEEALFEASGSRWDGYLADELTW